MVGNCRIKFVIFLLDRQSDCDIKNAGRREAIRGIAVSSEAVKSGDTLNLIKEKGKVMDLVKLNREEVQKAIEGGDNCQGRRWLAVRPNGDVAIHWADTNRPWDPWTEDAQVIGIPALFPEGEGTEAELAQDCLVDRLGSAEAKRIEEQVYQENGSLIQYADEHFGEWMAAACENRLDWLLEAFLLACNGYGAELNDSAPWGVTGDYGEEVIEPPSFFEWAE